MAELEVRLLGSLEVIRDGRPITISAPRLRGLLVLLALSAGRSVPTGRLVDALWSDELPANPRRSLHTYVNRLRGMLGPGSITTTADGYLLRVGPDQVDAVRFTRLLDRVHRAGDHQARIGALDEAIGIWRDVPFTDVELDLLDNIEGPRLVEQYLSAVELRCDLGTDDDPEPMISKLTELTLHHPLRESLWARLLELLDRAGRRAEALERYEYLRTMIADELGSQPSRQLQEVHAELLTDHPPVRRHAQDTPPPPPRQLPPDLRIFTGRRPELAELAAAGNDHDGGLPVTLIVGPPGVGKTSLAVHAAHRLSDGYPDGVLYVNLRGFDPGEQVLEPAEALQRFLAALAPDQPFPPLLDERVALYRTLLDGRQMLIILDNASSSDQVLPLLPSESGCYVIITSRRVLTGLITATGTVPLVLDTVSDAEAGDLLIARVGRRRVGAEPDAAAALVGICSGLPLALSLVGARAAAQPQLPLSALVDEIHDLGGALGAFAGDVAATDLRAVFSSSYTSLTCDAGRAFRLLGLAPGPDISLAAAASLLGLPISRSRTVLAELCQAHLLREHRPGRYATHDLLREYAAALAETVDVKDRSRAELRLIDHYVYTSRAAWTATDLSLQSLLPLAPRPPDVVVGAVEDLDEAISWWTDNRSQLVTAARSAARSPVTSVRTTLLLQSLGIFFELRYHWQDMQQVAELALGAACERGDDQHRAMAQAALAAAVASLGDLDRARLLFAEAAGTFADLGLIVRLAGVEMNLSKIADMRNDPVTGARYAGLAAADFRRAGHQRGAAAALGDLAWDYANLGRHAEALRVAEEAAELSVRAASPGQLAAIRDTQGFVHLALGDVDQAIDHLRIAVDLYRSDHDLANEADSLDHLGDAYSAACDHSSARRCWAKAYDILLRSGHPRAARIAPKLGLTDQQ